MAIGIWVLIGVAPILCAVAQTALLVTLNVCGLLWARRLILDPGGMVVENFAFLVLVSVYCEFSGMDMSFSNGSHDGLAKWRFPGSARWITQAAVRMHV